MVNNSPAGSGNRWERLLFRKGPVDILLGFTRGEPGSTGYQGPYVERVTAQLQEAGLLDEALSLTEEGQRVASALATALGSDEVDELSELRAAAKGDVSVVERGRVLRRLSAMERGADEEERRRIDEIRGLLVG
ncbi:MAG: hypothetical protein MAG715_01167 [Methanonatronarchaeales archaeon]|nr:hypothetical protein [Methanonatronarchaeales archaeon]